jgi:hypothetical protein
MTVLHKLTTIDNQGMTYRAPLFIYTLADVYTAIRTELKYQYNNVISVTAR